MSRIETAKHTRAFRRSFIPDRTLFYSKDVLRDVIKNHLGSDPKNTDHSTFILFLNSPPGFAIKAEILFHTQHLLNASLKERIFCIKNDITEKPKCEFCNSENVSFVDANKGYRRFCCQSCSAQSASTKEQRVKTNLQKYGNEIAFRNNDVKEKQQKTLIDRYGITNSWHLTTHNGVSKISQELFWNVWQNSKQYGEIYFGELNGELRLNIFGKVIKPDYAQIDGVDKRIIEFDGDYWHNEQSAPKDKTREKLLRDDGWKVLRIREREYKEDKLAIIEKCIAFLNKDIE